MEAALKSSLGRNVLGQTPFRIGRASDNTLVISDPQASGHHAEIAPAYGGNGYQITDLNSTNGTFINEQRLAANMPRPLYSGDVIRIGTTSFTYETSGANYQATERASSPNYEPTIYGSPPAQPSSPQFPAQPAYQQPPPAAYGNVGTPVPPPATPPPGYPQPGYPQPAYPQQQSYPQQAYPQPGSFGQPGYPQQQKKSRAGCWITLIVILLLLVAGGGGAYYYFTRVNPNPLFTQITSTPQKTLQTYCSALKSGDYQTAYNQLSKRAQGRLSESDFAQTLQTAFTALGGLKDCTVGTVTQNSNTTATGSVTYTFGDGKTLPGHGPMVYENGAWKIDSSNPNG